MSVTPFTPFRAFGGGAVISLDPDAAAYIAAITTAGATVSPTQSAAIDAFIVAEKAAGRWASIGRLYLPIWALEAPNAICMRSLTSGSYPYGATHGAGFLQGNGTTQYFNTGVSQAGAGMTSASAMIGVLIKQADTRNAARYFFGIQNVQATIVYQPNLSNCAGWHPSTANTVNLGGSPVGIITMSAIASNSRRVSRRVAAGVTSTTNTESNTSALRTENLFLLCRNVPGYGESTFNHTDAQIGAAFAGSGLADSATDAFTANLKTLWETCTGLTLP